PTQRMIAVQVVGPERDHQQYGSIPQVTGQKAQQVAGGPVGPVHILDDQDHRLLVSKRLQQRQQQFEQPPAGGLRVSGRRQDAKLRQQRRQLASPRPWQQ